VLGELTNAAGRDTFEWGLSLCCMLASCYHRRLRRSRRPICLRRAAAISLIDTQLESVLYKYEERNSLDWLPTVASSDPDSGVLYRAIDFILAFGAERASRCGGELGSKVTPRSSGPWRP
jgi:hypothetical protein